MFVFSQKIFDLLFEIIKLNPKVKHSDCKIQNICVNFIDKRILYCLILFFVNAWSKFVHKLVIWNLFIFIKYIFNDNSNTFLGFISQNSFNYLRHVFNS